MAHGRLADMKVAFLLTNGFEDSELTSPWETLVGAGAQPVLISPESGVITGKKGHRATVDIPLDLARPDLFDALVLPGGRGNAEHLRTHERAVAFVREFFETTKPVAAICHGGLILAKADVIRGRTLTSYPSIADDLRERGRHLGGRGGRRRQAPRLEPPPGGPSGVRLHGDPQAHEGLRQCSG